MLRLLADENFNRDIVRGLLRRQPNLDVVRIQAVGLSGATDPVVLEWAATEGRLLLTRDVTTLTRYANERAAAGQRQPDIIKVSGRGPLGQAIEDIRLLAELSREGEWEGQIICLPWR